MRLVVQMSDPMAMSLAQRAQVMDEYVTTQRRVSPGGDGRGAGGGHLGILREQGRVVSCRELGEDHLGVNRKAMSGHGYKWKLALDALRREGRVVVTQGRTGGLRAV